MARLFLAGLPGPIIFTADTRPAIDALRSVLVGWPELTADELGEEQAAAPPFLSVMRKGGDILVTRLCDGWTSIEPSITSAVCTTVVELMAGFVDAAPKLGSLHAAAAEFAGRLVVFPASHRAGKSTLVAALGASGHRVFADDLLPIDLETREAVASGCLPRLRLPLPTGAPDTLVQHVERLQGLGDGYYSYLEAAKGNAVSHGDRASLGAIVLLDRSGQPVEARLEPVEADEALLRLLLQDTKNDYVAQWAFERYLDLVEGVSIHRLTFSDLADAVHCLETAFATWPQEVRMPGTAEHDEWCDDNDNELRGQRSGEAYRRNDTVAHRVVGGSAFLVDPASNEIHHLNTLGLGLWNLLEEETDAATIMDVFCGAFPDTPGETIRHDVRTLLETFVRQGLVHRSD